MTPDNIETRADTRQRLIEAASEIFIEQGYKAAKIRDIVHRAGANVAAVNYHFDGKEGLYAEVIRQHAAQAIEDFAHAAANREGHEHRLRGPRHHVENDLAALV